MSKAVKVVTLALSLTLTTAAQARVLERTKINGNSAFASWDYSQDGLLTFVTVGVTNNDLKAKQAGKTDDAFVAVGVLQVDTATDTIVLSGTAQLAPGEFTFDIANDLSSARLQASGIFRGEDDSALPISIDVTWTATGAPVDHRDRSSFEEPGFKLKTRFDGTHRAASVASTPQADPAGVIVDGRQLTPIATADGEVQFNRFGSITIQTGR